MNGESQELAKRFFLSAYTTAWIPGEVSEDDMLRSALAKMSLSETTQLKQIFQGVLRQDDDEIHRTLVDDFDCQTQPFVAFGPPYKHLNARQMLKYICGFIDQIAAAKPSLLSLDSNRIIEADGTLVATLNDKLGDKAAAYGRLFAVSSEMADFLESQIDAAMQDYEGSFEDAEAFKADTGILERGAVYVWKGKSYPDLPDWLSTGLSLIAKMKGDGTTGQ